MWIAWTGVPGRDLPERFGKGNTVWRRFAHGRDAGLFEAILDALAAWGIGGARMQMIDSIIVRAHQHGAGGKEGSRLNVLGRSQAGFSTKIQLVADANRLPLSVHLTLG